MREKSESCAPAERQREKATEKSNDSVSLMHDAWHAKECDGKRESQFQRKVFLMFEAKVTSNDAKSSAP